MLADIPERALDDDDYERRDKDVMQKLQTNLLHTLSLGGLEAVVAKVSEAAV